MSKAKPLAIYLGQQNEKFAKARSTLEGAGFAVREFSSFPTLGDAVTQGMKPHLVLFGDGFEEEHLVVVNLLDKGRKVRPRYMLLGTSDEHNISYERELRGKGARVGYTSGSAAWRLLQNDREFVFLLAANIQEERKVGAESQPKGRRL